MAFELRSYLEEKRLLVDSELKQVLHRYGQSAPTSLTDAMQYSLLASGKRLRPILTLMACKAVGGEDIHALPAACALEMIHTYSLIHDDLPAMDDDDLRRGLPTCHVKFGEALAILAGDALLTMAFQVLSDRCPPEIAAVSCLELARGAGAIGMVGGQVLDLAAENRLPDIDGRTHPPESISELELIHRKKTGALFRSALRLGFFASHRDQRIDTSSPVLERLDIYAHAFGLCFQITDDLLDVEGCEQKAGKRVQKDANRGKLTYPSLLGLDESRKRAHALFEEAVRAVEPLGEPARPLIELARFVLERDR